MKAMDGVKAASPNNSQEGFIEVRKSGKSIQAKVKTYDQSVGAV